MTEKVLKKPIALKDKEWFPTLVNSFPDKRAAGKKTLTWKANAGTRYLSIKGYISGETELYLIGLWHSEGEPFYVARFTEAEIVKKERFEKLLTFFGGWLRNKAVNELAAEHPGLLRFNDAQLALRLISREKN